MFDADVDDATDKTNSTDASCLKTVETHAVSLIAQLRANSRSLYSRSQ